MNNNGNSYREALQDDESLATFLKAMKNFDQQFCDCMTVGSDFTLKLEIRGCKGVLLHVRVNADMFERPRGMMVQELRGKDVV